MRKIKNAGTVLKGETLLDRGLRWKVVNAETISKKFLLIMLHRFEKGEEYHMAWYLGVNDDVEWVVTK